MAAGNSSTTAFSESMKQRKGVLTLDEIIHFGDKFILDLEQSHNMPSKTKLINAFDVLVVRAVRSYISFMVRQIENSNPEYVFNNRAEFTAHLNGVHGGITATIRLTFDNMQLAKVILRQATLCEGNANLTVVCDISGNYFTEIPSPLFTEFEGI